MNKEQHTQDFKPSDSKVYHPGAESAEKFPLIIIIIIIITPPPINSLLFIIFDYPLFKLPQLGSSMKTFFFFLPLEHFSTPMPVLKGHKT